MSFNNLIKPQIWQIAIFGVLFFILNVNVSLSANAVQKIEPNKISYITKLNHSTKNGLVKIEIELDKISPWEVRSISASAMSGTKNRLILDLSQTKPNNNISAGSKIKNSPLTMIRIDYSKLGLTRIFFDFDKLARFNIEEKDNLITILATDNPKILYGGLKTGNIVRSPRAVLAERKSQALQKIDEENRAFRNMASQFGLNISTIVIDAGHGGRDPGAAKNGLIERDLNLDLALRLGKVLAKQGYIIKYTRSNNAWVPLDNRVNIANKLQGDLFISLHVNSSPNPAKSGVETYYLDASKNTADASLASMENMLSKRKLGELEKMIADLMRYARKDESQRLAKDIQKNMLAYLRKNKQEIVDGGSRGAPFVVLMNSKMPSVLIEVGYCTNIAEAKKLALPKYRDNLAQGIANGIFAYADRLQKKITP